MSEKYDLDLLENAIDSLNEAILKYMEGSEGNHNAYKFCILHYSHFLELLFKYYVYKAHPLLIYKNPFAKKIDENSLTIGLPDAIQFLKNEGKDLSIEFLSDLDWIKQLRNKIEHHKFSMDVERVKECIGRLTKTVYEFNETYSDIDIAEYIENIDAYDVFIKLAETYKFKVAQAEKEADKIEAEAQCGLRPKEYDCSGFQRLSCPICKEYTFVGTGYKEEGYRCTLCGNTESEEIEVTCGICGVPSPKYEMNYTSESGYICKHHLK